MSMIKCPECGSEISTRAPQCPNCGATIEGNTVSCTNCGYTYFKDEKACPKCGCANTETHNANKSIGEVEKKTRVDKNRKIVRTVALLAAIVAIVVGVCYYSSYKNKKIEYEAWQKAMASTDEDVLQAYLDSYVDAPAEHRDSIMLHIGKLQQADREWTNVVLSNSRDALQQYLDTHPDTPYRNVAEQKIDSMDWSFAKSQNTEESIAFYKRQHPMGAYIEEADDLLKQINAKTVHAEEKSMVKLLMSEFFRCINTNDEVGLRNTVADVMSSFLGKESATKNDVGTFLHKIYKADVESMSWTVVGDMSIDKKEIGDNKYEYAASFMARQEVKHHDGSNIMQSYRITSKIDPDGKIMEFNMDRINQ